MDTGFLRQLLQEAVKTFLIDSMVLDTFGLLRYLRDQTFQIFR